MKLRLNSLGPSSSSPTPLPSFPIAMSPKDELEYLKSLVAQLNDKIHQLEQKAKPATAPSPARQLRTILIGPPGAGELRFERSAVVFWY
ncbi:hypothetical protein ONZ45_g6336 [Pleurotus djamor]|nr:hypothetical protein ONZ45_g6336 [Pleurotus djamor]